MSTEELGSIKTTDATETPVKATEEKPFKPASGFVNDLPHLFEKLPLARLKHVDEKINGGIVPSVFGEPDYKDVVAVLSGRTPDPDKPKIELEECVGAGSFTTVWRGKINGVPTGENVKIGGSDDEKNKWQFAVIRLTQRGLDFIDSPSLNDPTCLGYAHRETFNAGGHDFWLSVVPNVIHEGVTTIDTLRTGRLIIARGVDGQIADFQNDQFANLVTPDGKGIVLPPVTIGDKQYDSLSATVIADRNATCNIKGETGFIAFSGGNTLGDSMQFQMSSMFLQLKDLPPIPPEAVEKLSAGYAEAQLGLIAGITSRFGLSERALVEQASAYNFPDDKLAELRTKAAAIAGIPSLQNKPVAEPLADKEKGTALE